MLTIYQILARAYSATEQRRKRELNTMACAEVDSETYRVAEYWSRRYSEELEWLEQEIQREEAKEEGKRE